MSHQQNIINLFPSLAHWFSFVEFACGLKCHEARGSNGFFNGKAQELVAFWLVCLKLKTNSTVYLFSWKLWQRKLKSTATWPVTHTHTHIHKQKISKWSWEWHLLKTIYGGFIDILLVSLTCPVFCQIEIISSCENASSEHPNTL